MFEIGSVLKVGRGLTGTVFAVGAYCSWPGETKVALRINNLDVPEAHRPQWILRRSELIQLNK